jgi:hypothetical protein
MIAPCFTRLARRTLPILWLAGALAASAAESPELERRVRSLEEKNQSLMDLLRKQQDTIERLERRLEATGTPKEPAASASDTGRAGGVTIGNLHITGEAGAGWFHTWPRGSYPGSEFRVDEAKLFLEAPLWNRTYIFAELDLMAREREEGDDVFHLGELYVDFENISRLWNQDDLLGLRAGRLDIPFGEEYVTRDVIDNPLISHSLSDVWGVDEGVELYGKAGRFDYVAAVQNGGRPSFHDYDSDKAVAARLGYQPVKWARVSASLMRTGNLAMTGDKMSEVWFGNGFFRALGGSGTTTKFHADMIEGDVQFFWPRGGLKTAAGLVRFDDDDRARDNRRNAFYYYIEPRQELFGGLYAAARFSQIRADEGLPLVGYGAFGPFFFGPLTRDIWRLSFGLGYQWSRNLVFKLEYTREQRELLNAPEPTVENFLGTEIGLKF